MRPTARHRAGPALQIAIDDGGVDIAAAADGDGVAEALRHAVKCRTHFRGSLALAGEGACGGEGARGQHRAVPGAEILGGGLLARDGADVGVDVGRGDIPHLALLVLVLEKILARQVLDGAHDARDAPVTDAELPHLAALALEAEMKLRTFQRHVAVLQRGQSIAVIALGIFRVADADQRAVEKVHHGCQHLLPRDAARRHVCGHARAQFRQA